MQRQLFAQFQFHAAIGVVHHITDVAALAAEVHRVAVIDELPQLFIQCADEIHLRDVLQHLGIFLVIGLLERPAVEGDGGLQEVTIHGERVGERKQPRAPLGFLTEQHIQYEERIFRPLGVCADSGKAADAAVAPPSSE